jgi:hypothetical protein
MPGFEKTLTEDQMWQVSEMLAKSDKLPESALQQLRAPMPGPM